MIHYYYGLQFRKPETADKMQLDERQAPARVVVEDTPLLSEENYPKKSNSRKKLFIGGAAALVVVLALGLGLGLGLKSDEENVQSYRFNSTCKYYDNASFKQKNVTNQKIKWLEQSCSSNHEICPDGFDKPPLIIVSLDGFRADYMKRNLTPVLDKIGRCGVRTDRMRSIFPTKTFPNHFSIVTGLYPESHGIIDNNMYDMELEAQFSLSSDEKFNPAWWSGEPIWNTVTKAGNKSAVFFWPGSEVIIDGYGPDYCYIYDESVPFEARVEQVLSWLGLPAEERPSFISLYFNEPDSAGHAEGPFGDLVNDKLTVVDGLVGQLMDGLVERGLDTCANVIVVSDHGMAPIDCSRTVKLPERFPDDTIYDYYIYSGPFGRVTSQYKYDFGEIVHVENGDSPDQILEKFQCEDYNNTVDWYLNAYKKEDLPKRFHYANNDRIEEVVLNVADEWLIQRSDSEGCYGGNHGWDNTFESMQALFVGLGPGFKAATEVETFENFELYNLMAELLELDPAPNNGTLGSLRHLMSNPPSDDDLTPQEQSKYINFTFPDSQVASQRRNASNCSCSFTEDREDSLDEQLNLSEEVIAESLTKHLVYGTPILTLEDEEVCQLVQTDYISTFNHKTHLASWVAYTLEGQPTADYPGLSVWKSDSELVDCARTDVRLSNESVPQCSELTNENLTLGFLYHPGYSTNYNLSFDAYIISNRVPMYNNFKTGTWKVLLELLEEYSIQFGLIQVCMGPIYDFNYDGRADSLMDIPEDKFINHGRVPLPSHYFAVALRCDNLTQANTCTNTSEVISVVLPHKQTDISCWDKEMEGQANYIKNNVARVRDIELLTGLQFFPDLENTPRLRLDIHLQVGLWERLSWMDQSDICSPIQSECTIQGYNENRPPVLLISIDGFRADYMLRNETPVLQKLADCGVSTEYMSSIYPTLTFPNHYSIVTGLYPESHGIVDNNMYDTELNMGFSLGGINSTKSAWWGGEPIWNSATQENLTSMAFFWVGTDVEISGMRPTKYFPYDGEVPNSQRVDTILKWLNGSEERLPDLMLLYFDKVDKAGHEGGPDSEQVTDALYKIDDLIGELMDGLYRLNMHKCLNIIITSDHGMSDLSCDRQVILNDHLDEGALDELYVYTGAAGRIANKYTYEDGAHVEIPEAERIPVEDLVKDTNCVSEYMNIYAKADLPKRFHYTRNERIDEVVAVMDDTWAVDRYSPWCGILGQHGWEATFDSMRALFISYGPSFKSEFTTDPFENIELYNLLAELLNITVPSNNGTRGSLSHILRTPQDLDDIEGSLDYNSWSFPADEDYESIIDSSECTCDLSPEELIELDIRLNLTNTEKDSAVKTHIPHGVAAFLPASDQLRLLQQEDYIQGYSEEFYMPKWAAFKAAKDAFVVNSLPNCVRSDIRVNLTFQNNCSDFTDYIPTSLFPFSYSSSNESVPDTLILTNTVPMLEPFAKGIWNHLLTQTIRNLADALDNLFIVLGPAFDYNLDGLPDDITNIPRLGNSTILVPSHYFAVILQCADVSGFCTDMKYNVRAYLLPHRENVTNCMDSERYLFDNRVRMRDIELVTGLEFLTANRTLESVRTRTTAYPNNWIPKSS